MRVGLMLWGGACLAAPSAEASSFVTVAPPKQALSSSFVVLGAAPPPPPKEASPGVRTARSALDAPPDFDWQPAPTVISASIIAMGMPAVEAVKVAAIPKPAARATPEAPPKPRRKPYILPKVVRAGVSGHAFPQYVPPAPAGTPSPAQAPVETQQRQAPDPAPPQREPAPALPPQQFGKMS